MSACCAIKRVHNNVCVCVSGCVSSRCLFPQKKHFVKIVVAASVWMTTSDHHVCVCVDVCVYVCVSVCTCVCVRAVLCVHHLGIFSGSLHQIQLFSRRGQS